MAAEDSIGQANAIAGQLPAEQGASLAESAADAFTQALSIGFTVAGAAALIAAIVVKRWLPDRHSTEKAPGLELAPAPA